MGYIVSSIRLSFNRGVRVRDLVVFRRYLRMVIGNDINIDLSYREEAR